MFEKGDSMPDSRVKKVRLNLLKRIRKKAKINQPYPPIPDGLCFIDGGPCVDRMAYTNCENCSCGKNLQKIKEKRQKVVFPKAMGKLKIPYNFYTPCTEFPTERPDGGKLQEGDRCMIVDMDDPLSGKIYFYTGKRWILFACKNPKDNGD